jgi:LuxR family maltose regulon positive regulatory protein
VRVPATDAGRPPLGTSPNEEFFESKLHPPPVRPALVSRRALVERLATSDDVPIASVVAPAGYGKTTLLAEWAQRDDSRVAWLSLDRTDNDPGVLLPYAAAALDRVEPIEPDLVGALARKHTITAGAARLAGAMARMEQPVTLVLDHFEVLENDECLDTIAELALHLPAGARLALASRTEPPLPLPRLRARGDVVEIGVRDLAMTADEARALLRGAGLEASDDDVHQLMARTEGWPVGLYLAALALKSGAAHENAGIGFTGDEAVVAEYLHAEIFQRISGPDLDFLTRTSILERMNASLCDAVLGATHSQQTLETLARSNLLLVGLDTRAEWYRYHHLFRSLLRRELERREPELIPLLHTRAAGWGEQHNVAEIALEHAQAAGDHETLNRVLLRNAQPMRAAGRSASVRRWIRWFDDHGLLPQYPAVAVIGALLYTSDGMAAEAEHWADAATRPAVDLTLADGTTVAERADPARVLPDGSTLASLHAILRVMMAREGVEGVRRDCEAALAELPTSNGYRGIALTCLGLCEILEGDFESADRLLLEGADSALANGRMPLLVIALAERGFVACRRGSWHDAAAFARQATEIVRTWHLEEYNEAAMADTLAARVAIHERNIDEARERLARAARLRPQLTQVPPIPSVHTLLEMARAYIALDDTAGAREVLRQARDILLRRPGLGSLPAEVEELSVRLDAMHTGAIGATSLTPAELRLVSFLGTHLTFPQIAERLFVSRNTVKSQAVSVYQKLGVSSRADAVQRLGDLGLLDA